MVALTLVYFINIYIWGHVWKHWLFVLYTSKSICPSLHTRKEINESVCSLYLSPNCRKESGKAIPPRRKAGGYMRAYVVNGLPLRRKVVGFDNFATVDNVLQVELVFPIYHFLRHQPAHHPNVPIVVITASQFAKMAISSEGSCFSTIICAPAKAFCSLHHAGSSLPTTNATAVPCLEVKYAFAFK